MAARQHGAKAMLVVTGPRSPNAGELVPMTFDTALVGIGHRRGEHRRRRSARRYSPRADKTLDDVQKALDSGNPHVAGFALPRVTVTVHAKVVREKHTGHNVVAYLPATTPVNGVDEAVGRGRRALRPSRSRRSWQHRSRRRRRRTDPRGADDNASGTAAVLAIAAKLARQPRQRNVMLAFWSGEELGLLGSARSSPRRRCRSISIAAYLNFDMVGRMQDNKLTRPGDRHEPDVGRSCSSRRTSPPASTCGCRPIRISRPTSRPSTAPASRASPSSPARTRTITGRRDTADKIDYEDLDRVVDFAAAIARRVDDATEAPAVHQGRAADAAGRREPRRRPRLHRHHSRLRDRSERTAARAASIGGGPAEAAGLQKGDVIVEIAGQTIANIYDYTYALDVLKIGQPAKVVYMRDGERKETTLTPAARK